MQSYNNFQKTLTNSNQCETENDNIYKLNEEYIMYLDDKIGAGAFGQIYKCQKAKTSL